MTVWSALKDFAEDLFEDSSSSDSSSSDSSSSDSVSKDSSSSDDTKKGDSTIHIDDLSSDSNDISSNSKDVPDFGGIGDFDQQWKAKQISTGNKSGGFPVLPVVVLAGLACLFFIRRGKKKNTREQYRLMQVNVDE